MELQPRDPNYLDKVRESFSEQAFMDYIGAKLTVVQPGYCEIELPYKKELSQQNGYFHGGMIGTLADNACGYAAYSLMPPDTAILSTEYKINLLAPGKGERLIAKGQVIKPGKMLTVCESQVYVIHERKQQLCATSLSTMISLAN